MRLFDVRFDRLIYQLLPPHKRQEARIKWLQSLIDLSELWDMFVAWRANQALLLGVNSQKKVLEGYLRSKLHPRIRISTYDEDLVLISLYEESQLLLIGCDHEITADFPLLGERTSSLEGADYIVMVPDRVSIEQVRIEVDRFNSIDKKYIIKQIR